MQTIYHSGKVFTGRLPVCEAFIVRDGRFVFVGTDAQALALKQSEDLCVDLDGAFVCAGFNDSHMHLLNYGQVLGMARLDQHTGSLEEMLACLERFLSAGSLRGGWLMGRGWNQDYFSDVRRMPNRWDLDRVSTEIPICVTRACGHVLSVNSRALELLGITEDEASIEGGEIGRENGTWNGLFFDNAMDLVYACIPAPGKEELKEMIRSACTALNSYGVTSCHSDDYCVFREIPWQTVNEAFCELESAGELTVRVYEQCNFTETQHLREFIEGGNLRRGSSLFRLGPLKMLGDGALGARTAYLSRPYADDPSTQGLSVFTQQQFDDLIGLAHEKGMQVAIHAIGDACLDSVLSALEKAQAAHPREDHRHGIVHCQITRPEQLEKMAAMKLHIYAQSIFLDYDTRIVESRVGCELAATSYSWKTLQNLGATVSNGTDCPVELPFALGGIQCAVTRKPLSGEGEPYLPGEAFSVEEALHSYTCAGAWASFEENEKGCILPGMLADFVVLGEDPFAVDPQRIAEIPVKATYLAGKKIYG